MEHLQSSAIKPKKDIYSRVLSSTQKTSPVNDVSTFITYDSSNFLIIDDADDTSSEEELEESNTNPIKSFIPPWRREESSTTREPEKPSKDTKRRILTDYRKSKAQFISAVKSDLSCVQEQESTTLSSSVLQPKPSNGNLTGVQPLEEDVVTGFSGLKPKITGGNKTGDLNPDVGLHPKLTGGALQSRLTGGKPPLNHSQSQKRFPKRSGADKENEVSGVVRGPFSEKKKSSSCSVLQTAAASSSSIDGDMQGYSNSKVHPALRGSASTNTLNQPAGRHGNPHSEKSGYDLSFSKSTKSVGIQTNSDWKRQILSESVVKPKVRPVVEAVSSSSAPAVVVVNKKSYTILNLIGKGGSSTVEQVFDFENARRLALKTVNMADQPPTAVTAFKKEIEMLEKLQFSDRVIKLVDYEYDQINNRLLLLLECGETDLAVYLKKRIADNTLHRMQRCVFWHDMLQAVKVLHEQGIVHSDIKPANFMLVAGEIKLIDFGIARQLDADATSMELESCVGTLNYMSPEVLQGIGSKDVNSKAGRKADVWSLGCILYYMTYGVTPFQTITSLVHKVTAISNPSHIIETPDIGEPLLTATIQLCLERNYKNRASIDELLRHPYVK